MEQFGIEDLAGLAQRSKRDTAATEQALHFIECAGLLNSPQAFDDGIEEGQQEQAGVLVVEQCAIARSIARSGVIVQTIEQVNSEESDETRALGLARKRWPRILKECPTDAKKQKQRLVSFLGSRGFSFGVIRNIYQTLTSETLEEE